MIKIAITGTPGVGKTYVSKLIEKELKNNVKEKIINIDLSEFIKKNKIYDSYDKQLETFIVDINKLKYELDKFLNTINNNSIIILDGHLSHYLNPDIVFVVELNQKDLYNRLRKRNYKEIKINDNLEANAFDICYVESIEQGLKTFKIKDLKIKNEIKTIINKIRELKKIKN